MNFLFLFFSNIHIVSIIKSSIKKGNKLRLHVNALCIHTHTHTRVSVKNYYRFLNEICFKYRARQVRKKKERIYFIQSFYINFRDVRTRAAA